LLAAATSGVLLVGSCGLRNESEPPFSESEPPRSETVPPFAKVEPAWPNAKPAIAKDDPVGAANALKLNAVCYKCHETFVEDELSQAHQKQAMPCIRCHGQSLLHVREEDNGATPPEVTFERNEVNTLCWECHFDHNVSAERVVARFFERGLSADTRPICTDCHGSHKIESSPDREDTGPKAEVKKAD